MIPAGPRFSVIVPTYHRPRQLRRCLEALARLEPPESGFEVIVVDDGSPGRVDALVSECAGKLEVRLVTQTHAGPAAARNAGAAQACGTFLAFTDDDCEPSAGWLRALAAALDQNPDAAVGGRTINALPDNVYAQTSQLLVNYLYDWHETSGAKLRFFASNNFAVSRAQFETLGGFSPSFRRAAAEDRDLCARWVEQGGALRYAPEAVVLHSHGLGLCGFCRQHFRYGRGARRFFSERAARGAGGLEIEPFRFYRRMAQFALRHGESPGRSLLLVLALGLSQATNAAGYCWGALADA